MAEDVQDVLDRMLPALNDLQERGIFTKDEIHAIVDRRRLSEYAIRRRQPRKADFLRYLQQEMDLEKLRKIRTKRQARERRGKSKHGGDHERSRHVGDRHIVSHLHIIWGRTLKKFKSDVTLFLKYAEFCKKIQAHRMLSRVYGDALRLHPNNVDLWIEAASHEFFEAGSVQNARILFQRSLRIHPKSENLWLQFFALELHFATKMIGRRKILKPEESPAKEDNDDHDPFAIAALVFENAMQQIPRDVRFRARFWDQCRMFPQTDALKRKIWDSVTAECGENPEAWLALAVFSWKPEKENAVRNDEQSDDDEDDDGSRGKDSGGFLKHDSDSSNEERPNAKRQKTQNGNTGIAYDKYSEGMTLSILKTAVQKFPTEEMFLKTIRTVNKYIDDMQQHPNASTSVEHAIAFLGEILTKASAEDFYSAKLAMEYSSFLERCGQKDDARACLEDFIDLANSDVEASVWIQLAELSNGDAVVILEKAAKQIEMCKKGHFHVLLCLLAASMVHAGDTDLFPLFNRILLLAPGFSSSLLLERESFGVIGLPNICLLYLRHVRNMEGDVTAQKACRVVLYNSSIAKAMFQVDEDASIDIFTEAIEIERSVQNEKRQKSSLKRLFDRIIEVVGDSPSLADEFRQKKQEELKKLSRPLNPPAAPSLNARSREFCAQALLERFEKYRVLHLSNVAQKCQKNALQWRGIGSLFSKLSTDDQLSWCVETHEVAEREQSITPASFLAPVRTDHRAYCSFLVQKDQEAFKETESRLPIPDLPGVDWSHESALWIFFGRNPAGSADLPGRVEHTDSISSDGTWHFQLSGSKKWFIRPTDELLQHMSNSLDHSEFQQWTSSCRLEIDCKQGDILIINTRLWFHQTRIPPQPTPSVSYARDFWCQGSAGQDANMSNVDGLYATADIEEGAIIFTEDTMPDCSLHRSLDPNCEVVETGDGTQAIVSIRDIKSGEFFCVAASDDETSDDGTENDNDAEE